MIDTYIIDDTNTTHVNKDAVVVTCFINDDIIKLEELGRSLTKYDKLLDFEVEELESNKFILRLFSLSYSIN